MTAPDLSISLCGVRLPNLLVLASGILGTGAELLQRVAQCGAGAVTSKSCGPAPRAGHPNPTVLDWGHGLINAVGLSNPGADEEAPILREAKSRLAPLGVPLVIRLTGTNEEAARRILADHGLSATTSMDEGVRTVIARAQEVTA